MTTETIHDSEMEDELDWYEKHANDHVIFFCVELRNKEKDVCMKSNDVHLPVMKITEWYRDRYKEVKSFNICYHWKFSLFYGKHLFYIEYTPEEMADFLEIGYEYYILTDLIPEMMDNVLKYADSDGNYTIIHNDIKFLVFSKYVSGHNDHIGYNPMDRIYALCSEDNNKKKSVHEELIQKAWHPSRFQKWCIPADEVG